MTGRSRLAAVGAVLAAAACVIACRSGAGADSGWSRAYVLPEERVWSTVLEVLGDDGFVVEEADREAGRIVATGGDSRMWREALLDVSIRTRGEVVRVEVGGRIGSDPATGVRRLDELVRAVLTSLDDRLLGHPRSSSP